MVLLVWAAFAASAFAQNDSNSVIPVVTIRATDAEASESGNPGLFTVFRDGPTNLTLNLFCVIEGSASNGVDYAAVPNTVTIPAGVRSVPLPVTPTDDNLVEGSESVVVRLVYPLTMPPINYLIGTPNTATVIIADNDPPPTNQPPTITIVSPANNAAFNAPATIYIIASVHDADGIAAAAAVEFFAGTSKLGNGQLFDPGPPHEAAFRFIWTNVPPGEYNLTAKVTDDHGATRTSEPVHIRVEGAPALPVVTISATDHNAAEPEDRGTFTVFRDGSTNNTLQVYYVIGGSASNGVDYVTLSNRVTVPAGVKSAQITVAPKDDVLVEGTETVELRLVLPPFDTPQNYRIGSPSNAVVTILDNDPPTNIYQPIVTIEATDAHTSELGVLTIVDPGVFTIYRAGNTSATLYVHYRIEGTASNGVDYPTLSNIVVIPAGATSARVIINPLEDILPEGTETVVLRLEERACIAIYPPPPDCYRVGTPGTATVYIADNDAEPTNHPPTVHIFTPTNGSSFIAPANILIAAEAQDVDGYLTIQTVEFFEGVHSLGIRTNLPTADPIGPFKLVWTNVPPGNYELTAKVTDNRGASKVSEAVHVSAQSGPMLPVVTLRAVDPNASEPGIVGVIDRGVFTVTRTGNTNDTLLVHYSIQGTASNGVDYAAISNAVVIPAGHLVAEIAIFPLGDNLLEGTETVVLRLEDVLCAAIFPPPSGCYQVGTPREAVVNIANFNQPTNHPPTVQIVKPHDGQMFLAPTNVLIVADTTDSDGYVGKVEFFADEHKLGEQTKLFLVPPPAGEHISYEFVWTNPPPGSHVLKAKATDDDGATAGSEPVRIWIVATNEPPHTNPPVVTITAPDAVASEGTNFSHWPGWPNSPGSNPGGTNAATFVVRRTGDTNASLTVHYHIGGTASNGVDYLVLPDAVTIPAGRRAAEFRLVPVDDALSERVETVVLELRMAPDVTNTPPPYLVGLPSRAAAIIVDNDQPRPVTGPLSDRSFHITRPDANGTWWRIECSSDMLNWAPLCTNKVTDGALHFVDPDGDELPQRFYRAVPELNPPLTE